MCCCVDAALMLPDFQKFNADERKRAVAMKLLNSDAKGKNPVQEAERPASSPSSGEHCLMFVMFLTSA